MHIVTGAARAMENHLFRSMFEERKRVFIDLLRWDVPVLAGRYEIDQFDNDRAVYIVIADAEGAPQHMPVEGGLCKGEILRVHIQLRVAVHVEDTLVGAGGHCRQIP